MKGLIYCSLVRVLKFHMNFSWTLILSSFWTGKGPRILVLSSYSILTFQVKFYSANLNPSPSDFCQGKSHHNLTTWEIQFHTLIKLFIYYKAFYVPCIELDTLRCAISFLYVTTLAYPHIQSGRHFSIQTKQPSTYSHIWACVFSYKEKKITKQLKNYLSSS